MGVTKTAIPARFDAANVQYIDDICFSRYPNLKRSSVINMIVESHRLLVESGILKREFQRPQQIRCVQAEDILGIEPKAVTCEGTGQVSAKDCAREKSA